MDKTWILIAFVALWIVIWILLRFLGILRPIPPPVPPNIEAMLEQGREEKAWSKPSNIPGGHRNTCGIYTFVSTNPASPAGPTLNKEALDALTPVPVVTGSCVDPDQIAAIEQERTCEPKPPVTMCMDTQGNTYLPGQKEILYEQCDVDKCIDTIGLVALNFRTQDFGPDSPSTRCLQRQGTAVTVAPCNVADPNQIFRIQRIDATTMTQSATGQLARFVDRETGLCVMGIEGLTMADCSPNEGYTWLLMPPASIRTTDGSTVTTTPTPQQIVYNPQMLSPPMTETQLTRFISTFNPISLCMVQSGEGLWFPEFRPFFVGSAQDTTCTSQILDYSLYQVIANLNPDYYPWNP